MMFLDLPHLLPLITNQINSSKLSIKIYLVVPSSYREIVYIRHFPFAICLDAPVHYNSQHTKTSSICQQSFSRILGWVSEILYWRDVTKCFAMTYKAKDFEVLLLP